MQHPDPDRLALAALPSEPPDPAVTQHLRQCRLCRDHVAALRRTVDLARDGSPDAAGEIPPERVWDSIAAQIDTPATPSPRRPAPPRSLRVRYRATALVGALALLIGLLAGSLITLPRTSAPVVVATTQLAQVPADDGAGGAGTAIMTSDGRLEITLADTGPLPAGSYLEVWLTDDTLADTVALGTVRIDDGIAHAVLTMPTGLPDEHLNTIDVSLQPLAGNAGHSGRSIVRGTMP